MHACVWDAVPIEATGMSYLPVSVAQEDTLGEDGIIKKGTIFRNCQWPLIEHFHIKTLN